MEQILIISGITFALVWIIGFGSVLISVVWYDLILYNSQMQKMVHDLLNYFQHHFRF